MRGAMDVKSTFMIMRFAVVVCARRRESYAGSSDPIMSRVHSTIPSRRTASGIGDTTNNYWSTEIGNWNT
jgi:hypothetical protein